MKKLSLLEIWNSGSAFGSFVRQFGNFAVKTQDRELLRFGDRLVGYSEYMRDLDPYEFANHFARQVGTSQTTPAHPYRDNRNLNPEKIAQSQLEKISKLVASYNATNPKFATMAQQFFRNAASAL